MASYRGLAGVSATLRSLLRDRMEDPVDVTIAPPDTSVDGVSGPRVNLYLYHLSENGSLKNQPLPGGIRPPLSLDLHYLMTAFGGDSETAADADLQAQQVLGDAMRVLHDHPIVTPGLHEDDDPTEPQILDPSLVGEVERIKVTLDPLEPDEVTRLWTALPQASFRRSVAYEVTVVQIESALPATFPRPVRTRRLGMAALRRPLVREVYRTPASPAEPRGDARARVLQELTVDGLNLRAASTYVRLGGLEPIGVVPASDTRLAVTVPDDTYPPDADHPVARPIPPEDRLQPGPQVVEVLIRAGADVVSGGLDRGTSGTDTVLQGSNQAVFMLVPQITGRSPASGPDGSVLTVDGARLFRPGRVTSVLVGDRAFTPLDPDDPASPPGTVRTDLQVQVAVTGLAPSATPYPIRVRANGAESLEETFAFEVTP